MRDFFLSFFFFFKLIQYSQIESKMVTIKYRINDLIICVIVQFEYVPHFKTSEQSHSKITKDLPASCMEVNKPVQTFYFQSEYYFRHLFICLNC